MIAPSNEIRVGIVGCGLIGRQYAARLGRLGAPVVALADPLLERAQQAAEASGAAVYGDLRRLLDEQAIDLICVCSPTPSHHAAVLAAAGRGLHIFCEKPLAENLKQAREMCRAAHEAGVTMGIGFKMRYEAVFARAKSLIEAGEIGAPLYSIFSYFQQLPPPERSWYTDFGTTRDNVAHAIDLSNWLLDRQPALVSARLDNRLGFKGEDKVFLRIGYGDGALASIHGGWVGADYPAVAASDDILFQVVGEAGYVAGDRAGHIVIASGRGIERRALAPVDSFSAELAAFLNALRLGEPPPVPAAAGLVAQAVIEAAFASDRSGETVSIGARDLSF
ncbi:MAG: Gfo/Idh/MocA family oxidoreductase [Chloroflexota bacterium]|nr:Gfo/Idh/MocA family oxidoreductase [Chloroflexota bacterium]MDE2910320.1 Gfo/Idh/MocA family oxidoreductase [Chloroflexota bacterium]